MQLKTRKAVYIFLEAMITIIGLIVIIYMLIQAKNGGYYIPPLMMELTGFITIGLLSIVETIRRQTSVAVPLVFAIGGVILTTMIVIGY